MQPAKTLHPQVCHLRSRESKSDNSESDLMLVINLFSTKIVGEPMRSLFFCLLLL